MPPKKRRKTFDEMTVSELRAFYEDAEHASASASEQPSLSAQADRLRRALASQLVAGMIPPKELSDSEANKLKTTGRDVVAVMPNVSNELMAELGLDKVDDKGDHKDRFANFLFDPAKYPQKAQQSGALLRLNRVLSVKYIKTHSELQISGSYKWLKRAVQPKRKAKIGAEGEEGAEAAAAEEVAAGDEAAAPAAGEAAAPAGEEAEDEFQSAEDAGDDDAPPAAPAAAEPAPAEAGLE